MITFRNVSIRFQDIIVMEKFYEDFEENKINCILGPSGCGKTSLLNMLCGILKEDSGIITKPERISYVFQEPALIPQKTARQNLEIVLKSVFKDRKKLNTVINEFLKASDLENASDLYPHEMSGGMRQRLALIRAFAYPSDILLMDEPFLALDIALKNKIIEAFLHLYEEDSRTVIYVTHDIDEALMTGDFIYVYSNKPMRLQRKFVLDGAKRTRKLYDDGIVCIKNDIYKETEKW